jgi:hypothetical protein
MTIGTLKARNDTWLKSSPSPAASLSDDKKVLCPRDTEIEVEWIADEEEQGHRKIDLVVPHQNKFAWYTYIEHWEVEEALHPKLNEFDPPEFTGTQVQLPGLGRRFLDQPVDGCKNFSWGELLHGGTRIPNSNDIAPGLTPGMVINNIIKITKQLEIIRADYGGRPITITSGYRSPKINKAIGGASRSIHMSGLAVDFRITGINPFAVYRRYDPTFIGGLASSSAFTHIDLRGFRSRWRYPN